MSRPFPIVWTREGLVYHNGASPPVIFERPLRTTTMQAIVLLWREAWSFSVRERWPEAELTWEGGTLEISPRPLLSPKAQVIAEGVERFVAFLEDEAPAKIRARGWLDHPEQPWERAERMPEIPSDEAIGEGAFRSSRRRIEEPALAVRERPGSLEAMFDWLASSPDHPWRSHPREVRVSAEFLYAQRPDQTIWRLPLQRLRKRRGGPDEDAGYVFGRRTLVVLPHREPRCPVRAFLDQRLEARAERR